MYFAPYSPYDYSEFPDCLKIDSYYITSNKVYFENLQLLQSLKAKGLDAKRYRRTDIKQLLDKYRLADYGMNGLCFVKEYGSFFFVATGVRRRRRNGVFFFDSRRFPPPLHPLRTVCRRLPAGRACPRRLYKKQMFKTNSGGIRRHSRKQCGIEKERKTARLQYLSACLSAQLPHKARPAAAGACRALQQGQHTRNCGKRTDAATLDSSDWQKLRKKKLFAAACARIFQINASPTRKLPLFCGYPLLSSILIFSVKRLRNKSMSGII